MVRVANERRGCCFFELQFDLQRRLAPSEASPVSDAKYVGVYGDGGLSERNVEDNVRGLPSNARQHFKLVSLTRNFAAEFVYQNSSCSDHVLGLGIEKADRFYVLL